MLIETARSHRLVGLSLRVGERLSLLVREAPAGGGRGVVSLAGVELEVRLPAGLEPGQTLTARVVEASPSSLVLRVEPEPGPGRAGLAHAAGALAVSGDPELVRAAIGLVPAGLALPLPNGDALALQCPEGGEQAARAGFVLHSAALGPIELQLSLADGALVASVLVESAALGLAHAAAPALAAALGEASGVPARVGVAVRGPSLPRLAAPRVAEGLDAYA